MQAYSMDLRVRVMADVDGGGMTMRAVAKKYSVSEDWIRKLKRLRRKFGSFGPRRRQVSHATKLDHDLPRIVEFVAEKPDSTLREIRDELQLPVSINCVDETLKRLDLTFKKRVSMRPSNTVRTFSNGDACGAPNRPVGRSND